MYDSQRTSETFNALRKVGVFSTLRMGGIMKGIFD